MPYRINADLPLRVRAHLPEHGQDIFREAFNHAWLQYAGEGERREEIANRVAWAAVKRRYQKLDGRWVDREEG
jgi:cation transport regulator